LVRLKQAVWEGPRLRIMAAPMPTGQYPAKLDVIPASGSDSGLHCIGLRWPLPPDRPNAGRLL
jgi:hypothetical protein